MDNIKTFVSQNYENLLQTLRELCAIPAPSHFERERANYCALWLKNSGAEGVYIDEAQNVVFPLNCQGSGEITVLVAHTDTVFPDKDPMPICEDEETIRCPGVGDDTASLAVLLYTAKYFIENNINPQKGILFVCNSCEEGLGNLKGTRKIFEDYKGRIKQFISFDSNLDKIANRCVGSHRYEVNITTEGGHSYLAFGKPNAIAQMAEVISELYKIQVPEEGNSKTTYNVGHVSGGTSVNTISPNAKILCEYRSDNKRCFDMMEENFKSIFENFQNKGVDLSYNLIGERPCMGDVDVNRINELSNLCSNVIETETGNKPKFISSSTDCNIPLSLGVPAVCMGVFMGGGMHTREEWINKESLKVGLSCAVKVMLSF